MMEDNFGYANGVHCCTFVNILYVSLTFVKLGGFLLLLNSDMTCSLEVLKGIFVKTTLLRGWWFG
jgi:hypothetical protein